MNQHINSQKVDELLSHFDDDVDVVQSLSISPHAHMVRLLMSRCCFSSSDEDEDDHDPTDVYFIVNTKKGTVVQKCRKCIREKLVYARNPRIFRKYSLRIDAEYH